MKGSASALTVRDTHPRAQTLLAQEAERENALSRQRRDPVLMAARWSLALIVILVVSNLAAQAPLRALLTGITLAFGAWLVLKPRRELGTCGPKTPLALIPFRYDHATARTEDQVYLEVAATIGRYRALNDEEKSALLREANNIYGDLLAMPMIEVRDDAASETRLDQLRRELESERDPGVIEVLRESVNMEESRVRAARQRLVRARRVAAQKRLLYQAFEAVMDMMLLDGDALPVRDVVSRVAGIRQRVNATTDARDELDALDVPVVTVTEPERTAHNPSDRV